MNRCVPSSDVDFEMPLSRAAWPKFVVTISRVGGGQSIKN